jgi:hypothetical protein
MDPLRAELAERSPCEAASCPSWGHCASWLKAHGHAAIGQWLELALAGLRRADDRERLLAVIERVLSAQDPMVRQLWEGGLGWSHWFGPFVLAYVGPASPDSITLRAALGPLGMLLADDRMWIAGEHERLPELERGVPWLLTQTLPGAQQAIHAHLLHELRARFGDRAHEGHDLRWVWERGFISVRVPPPELPEGRAIVSCDTLETLRALNWDRVRELEGLVVVGPPELLARWPDEGHREPCLGPRPSFARRYEQLAAANPRLIGQLRAELEARPIMQAHTCPSWPVYLDWLLEQGDELLAEWLRPELAGDEQFVPFRTFLGTGELAPVRPNEARRLGELAHGAHALWLGPFMTAYVGPHFANGLGADELQAMLGASATFLPRTRVYTDFDQQWIDRALTPRDRPVLAPTPPYSTRLFSELLMAAHRERESGGLAYPMRVANPGNRLDPRPQRSFATNIGPIAADSEATAVVCLDTELDLQRQVKLWDHLQTFEHLVLLGTAELLARWPHAGEWIEPWRGGFGSESR